MTDLLFQTASSARDCIATVLAVDADEAAVALAE